jgi:hypothetical protein
MIVNHIFDYTEEQCANFNDEKWIKEKFPACPDPDRIENLRRDWSKAPAPLEDLRVCSEAALG